MSVKSVLIIRCGALGDLVYATSVIDALKLQFGNDTIIDFVSTPGSGTLFNKDSRVNRVFPLKHKKIPIFLSSQKKEIIKNSQKKAYDLLINFESGRQFKSLVNAINATKKTGYFFSDMTIPKDVVHMVDITKLSFKDIVSKDIFNKSFPKLIGTPQDELKKKFNLNEKYIIISPSNSHQKRNILNYRAWQNSSWIELIERLSKEIEVVIVGNKAEDDFFNLLKPYPNNVVDLVAKTSLPDLVGVIDNAAGLVATDTGTAHMASAVETEIFALIGPTPAYETGPYQSPTNKVHILSANLPCSPCYKTEVMKNCKDNICMKNITVEEVYNSIKSASIV
ncbi:glycosyl transferase, family 9 [Sulfurimonas gotlandica GD1]|uniref:Glycosyl transferase, family 9 n=1 Tax=Sulfurimonas gotlandica (strain DSM 19862 / JCM 16533 / GD1) TaxID=929558 RepID=B6BIY3_SULGG|nr:glycosyltransferase family 9 protein [Sulfurimonas gotlandica]EDZ63184.1 Heptosyltransferase superfamily [Sulfurimonas gotlandica GD1]EHP30494.1 glycosyl transferase, family 9 [Sulfurimonas gotlandica GD1]